MHLLMSLFLPRNCVCRYYKLYRNNGLVISDSTLISCFQSRAPCHIHTGGEQFCPKCANRVNVEKNYGDYRTEIGKRSGWKKNCFTAYIMSKWFSYRRRTVFVFGDTIKRSSALKSTCSVLPSCRTHSMAHHCVERASWYAAMEDKLSLKI